jgi:type IV secretion system protein VirB8
MKTLDEHYEQAKTLATDPDTGVAAERAMLDKEAKRLIQENKNFEKSKAAWRKQLTKAACIVAAVAVVLNIVQGIGFVVLLPLKTVETVVLMVDRISGTAEVQQPESEARTTFGEEVDKYFISDYVVARESYDWDLMQFNYDKVKAFSMVNGSTFAEWDTFIKSPKSPLAKLADKAKVVVEITSRNIDTKTSTAVIRYSKTIIGADGKPSALIPVTYYVATISYGYPNPKLKPQERRLNPLGMKINSFRQVEELIKG